LSDLISNGSSPGVTERCASNEIMCSGSTTTLHDACNRGPLMARYKVGSDGWHKRAQSRHGNRTSSRPFAGCDGEGGTRDGVHSYFYIRAGGEELYNENGD